jgi:hypothetical protein
MNKIVKLTIIAIVISVSISMLSTSLFSDGHNAPADTSKTVEKIGSLKGSTTTKTLSVEGSLPKFEVSAQTSGTLAGVEVTSMATYWAEMLANGTIYGECPNAGVFMAQDGVATFRASGTGSFTADGGTTFKGVVYVQTTAPSLASLNGAALVYNWDVDAEGNATWELWEWK